MIMGVDKKTIRRFFIFTLTVALILMIFLPVPRSGYELSATPITFDKEGNLRSDFIVGEILFLNVSYIKKPDAPHINPSVLINGPSLKATVFPLTCTPYELVSIYNETFLSWTCTYPITYTPLRGTYSVDALVGTEMIGQNVATFTVS